MAGVLRGSTGAVLRLRAGLGLAGPEVLDPVEYLVHRGFEGSGVAVPSATSAVPSLASARRNHGFDTSDHTRKTVATDTKKSARWPTSPY